ncbi:hypothetical protein EVAR_16543_1 [Eumeta japonica]|uniref:Uncharacterized protein n=1 Tax=Eumeta variegata TaxID=151549 RepID=A0A4C1U332_EUMVA|nr:hypothetical protein EVAR_16543_1 [Eumeta japonica]
MQERASPFLAMDGNVLVTPLGLQVSMGVGDDLLSGYSHSCHWANSETRGSGGRGDVTMAQRLKLSESFQDQRTYCHRYYCYARGKRLRAFKAKKVCIGFRAYTRRAKLERSRALHDLRLNRTWLGFELLLTTKHHARRLLTNKQTRKRSDSAYSPDLAPCDFFLFAKLRTVVARMEWHTEFFRALYLLTFKHKVIVTGSGTTAAEAHANDSRNNGDGDACELNAIEN